MTNRRQVLGAGVAASVWPLVVPRLGRAAATLGHGLEAGCIHAGIRDTRLAASAAFAARLAAQGLPLREIDGDVTRLWYDELALRWRESPVAIAGLTGADALFCLAELAWDHRMRVVFRAAPGDAGRDGAFEVTAPAHVLARLGAAGPESVAELAERAAEAVQAASLGSRSTARRFASAPAAAEASWVAWAIAPVRRR